ncbi:MAG: hypothetical protein ABF633_09140 [Clostridium sp.]|uniref:hypothetical protein n=1 Tax=Clostridium sp. TaxID=1506 RepID=UPI0039EC169F
MKSKKNIKIVISVVSLVILMFAAGCSNTNTNKNSGNQQSSATSGNSENNKSSNAASPDDEAKNATLSGTVTKTDGNKITIIKKIENKNGSASAPKIGSAEAAKNMVTFEVYNNTAVIVRTVTGKGAANSVGKDTTGSISDIKVDSFVDVWTKKDGDTVTATKVIVYIFN